MPRRLGHAHAGRGDARRTLWPACAAAGAGVHGRRHSDDRARRRCRHDDLLRRTVRAAPVALRRAGIAHGGDDRLSWPGRRDVCARFPRLATAVEDLRRIERRVRGRDDDHRRRRSRAAERRRGERQPVRCASRSTNDRTIVPRRRGFDRSRANGHSWRVAVAPALLGGLRGHRTGGDSGWESVHHCRRDRDQGRISGRRRPLRPARVSGR